jgi:Fe-S-cluster containining protein
MNIQQLVQDLQLFYDEMGSAFSEYQKSTNLTCSSECGKCCDNPNITATTLEMLPLAWDLYQRGIAEQWLEKLSHEEHSLCPLIQFHSPDRMKGQCTEYKFRPSICREFGVAGQQRKDGKKILSVCKYIKGDKASLLINEAENNPDQIPLMSDWTRRLYTIHPDLLTDSRPIAKSLQLALEKVLLYAQYSQ